MFYQRTDSISNDQTPAFDVHHDQETLLEC